MPTLTPEDNAALQQWFDREARKSCLSYCSNVVINSSPPQRFDNIIEDWQADILSMVYPAMEYAAGLRYEYKGPRRFYIVLPRGHDKTSQIARLATWAVGYARTPLSASSSAGDKDQARLIREAMEKELELNPWIPVTLNNYEAKGTGGKLEILSSDAPTSSGRFDDLIIMDELTYWKSRSLFDVLLSGAHKRPRSVVAIITNAGVKGSWQWQVLEAARNDYLWKVYEAPPYTKLASWLSDAEIQSQRRMLTRNHARRVYDNLWTDAAESPLLSYDEIARCYGSPLWKGRPTPREAVGNLYVGVDIGRTRHLTVISTVEDTGKGLKLRDMKVMEGESFAKQEAAVIERMDNRVRKLQVDRGGIGMQLAEQLCARYGSRCEGISCNASWQGQAALKMLTAFRERRIEIPNDSDLNLDLQQVEEVGTSKGGIPVVNTTESGLGHADRFWSIALALDAMPVKTKTPGVVSGRPRAIPLG